MGNGRRLLSNHSLARRSDGRDEELGVGMKAEKRIKGPNCYDCTHRRDLPGSAHSKCGHSLVAPIADNPLMNIAAIFAGVGRHQPVTLTGGPLWIRGNPHGISHGWFNWPMNFDPIWLEACDGFEKRKTKP